MKEQVVISVIGLAGTGKTTLSKFLSEALDFDRIEKDAFRRFIFNNYNYFEGCMISRPDPRHQVQQRISYSWLQPLVSELLKQRRSVILEGGVTRKVRMEANHFCKEQAQGKIKTIGVFLNLPEEVYMPRLLERDSNEGTDWKNRIISLREDFEQPLDGDYDHMIVLENSFDNEKVLNKILKIINA